MDSPYLSSSSSTASRTRADSTFSIHLTETGGVQKRSNSRPSRPRSISAATFERHPDLLPGQIQDRLNIGPPSLSSDSWDSARTSPQPQLLQNPLNPSNSASQQPTHPGATSSKLRTSSFQTDGSRGTSTYPSVTSSDMASLGYLPAPHYSNMAFHDPSYDPSYQQLGFMFGSSASPSQPIYATGPLHMEPAYSGAPLEPTMSHVSEPSYNSLNRTSGPFHQTNYDSLEFSMASAQNQGPVNRSISHSPLSSQHLGPLTPPSTSGLDTVQPQLAGSPPSMERIRSPSIYDVHAYSSSYNTPSVQAPLYPAPQSYSYPPPQSSTPQPLRRVSVESQTRVISQKNKPQCWEHGCNGREFSTFSNLLRHQREKSGTAAKSYCPKCGAEFTRTTARNGHLAHEKCSKVRRTSDIK